MAVLWKELAKAYIANLREKNFQRFCDELFTLALERYQPAKAGGIRGDLKNDGYYSNGRYFAAYAPARYELSKTRTKILDDFGGAKRNWGDNMKSWILLTRETQTADVHKILTDLRTANPGLIIDNWCDTHLLGMMSGLSDEQRNYLLEVETHPTVAMVEKDLGVVREILEWTMRETHSSDEDRDGSFIAVTEKIELNFPEKEQQDYVVALMNYAYLRIRDIEVVFSNLDHEDQRAVQADIVSNYFDLVHDGLDMVDIMRRLFSLYTPVGKERDPRYRLAVKALVLFFFEDCTWGRKTQAGGGTGVDYPYST